MELIPKNSTIYIAGPMQKYPQYNFPAFDEARDDLREAGWGEVISPADMDRLHGVDPTKPEFDESMIDEKFLLEAQRRDCKAIIDLADAIVMLPGWEQSTGAVAEYHLARWKHIPVLEWPSMKLIDKLHRPKWNMPAEPFPEYKIGTFNSFPDGFDVKEHLEPLDEARKKALENQDNPKQSCGDKKAPTDCVPTQVIYELGLAMLEGALKYGRHNYRDTKIVASTYYNATGRHMDAWWEGEDFDSDSPIQISHIAKAMASCAVLLDAILNDSLIDDRPIRPKNRDWMKDANRRAAELRESCSDPKPPHVESTKSI